MSLFARGWISSMVVLAAGTGVYAEDWPEPRKAVDLLPSTELWSLSFRDVHELEVQGEALIRAVEVPMSYRPSQLVGMALDWIGLRAEFNPLAPVALIATRLAARQDMFSGLVLAVPFQSRTEMAKKMGADSASIDPARLKPPANAGQFFLTGALDEKYLFLASGDTETAGTPAVRSMLDDPRLGEQLTPSAIASLNHADILIHFGIANLRESEHWVEPNYEWPGIELDENEQRIATAIQASVDNSRDTFLAFKLGDGLRLQARVHFQAEEDSGAKLLLDHLRPAGRNTVPPPTLAGLPAGPVLAAGATVTTDPRQQLVLRTVSKLLQSQREKLEGGLMSSWRFGHVTDLRQTLVLGALEEILPQARAAKFAIYPVGEGHYTTIVVLESDDPNRLIGTIRELCDLLVDRDPAGHPAPSLSEEEIRVLIGQLTAEDLATRGRASTRLLVQGSRSLEWLDKAAESDDPETAKRVQILLKKLKASTRERTQRLLTDNPLVSAHPRLTYHTATERIGDDPVDIIRLQLPKSEAAQAESLTEMFGTEWDHVRVVSLPRQVVISLGAPGPWLAEAVENLKHSRAGLAHDPRLVRMEHDPDRLIEMHLPISRFVEDSKHKHFMSGPPKKMSPSVALTACGLSANETEAWIDVHFPVEELRGLVAKRGWYW